MNSTQLERIDEIVTRYCGGNKAEMARKMGVNTQTVHAWFRRGNPSANTLRSILKAFPQVNETWFLTGEGEPINEEVVEPQKEYDIMDAIREQQRQNAEQQKQNAQLQEMLYKLMDIIKG